MPDNKEILLIHLGGLGDVVLSESVFHSLCCHFGNTIDALGNRRFLHLFPSYFSRIHSIESARWLYLFADEPPDNTWKHIIFIGKDREGRLRTRWQEMSREPMIFIDMYPEGAFPAAGEVRSSALEVRRSALEKPQRQPGAEEQALDSGTVDHATCNVDPGTPLHIEDYQLMQLPAMGIRPIKKEIAPKSAHRIIVYLEAGFSKDKWPVENFLTLYKSLKTRGKEVCLLESLGLDLDVTEKIRLQELTDVECFFDGGGVFVSNDSGMAHLAGAKGLPTITIFTGFDPGIWHPRGRNTALRTNYDDTGTKAVETLILKALDPKTYRKPAKER